MTSRVKRLGFTIIEVSLVLAISGFLFVGIVAGTSAIIARQRYNDSVQDFTEFLRRTYSEVVNVENVRAGAASNKDACTISNIANNTDSTISVTGLSFENESGYPGRTECAIYGKLITFGENNSTIIHVYDVIGKTLSTDVISADASFTTLEALKEAQADVIAVTSPDNSTCQISPAGNISEYNPQWNARIETIFPDRELFVGSILIVRSPISGTIHTYILDNKTIGVSDALKNHSSGTIGCSTIKSTYEHLNASGVILNKYLDETQPIHFKEMAVNFCVGSEDMFANAGRRRNVRITEDGRNSTAVELISNDSGDNVCQ